MTLLLTKLELQNLFGLNVWRHMSDPVAKRKKTVCGILISLVCLYIGIQTGVQVLLAVQSDALRLAQQLPWLAAAAAVFLLSLFNQNLYSAGGYELLRALPVSSSAIALSRLLRLYVTQLLISLLFTLPGLAVFAVLRHPNPGWYLFSMVGMLLIPLLPIAVSCLLNTAINLAAVRFRHRNAVQASLRVLMLIAVMVFPSLLAGPEVFKVSEHEMLFPALEKSLDWIPVWQESGILFAEFALISLAIFALFSVWICRNHASLIQKLTAVRRIGNGTISSADRHGILHALYIREARRYFASPVYVSNTIIGPILATAAASACLFVDLSPVEEVLPVPMVQVIPCAWCMVCCMMNPAAVSLSMEGSRIWILKSLPIPVRDVLRAKLLWSLTLMLPAYVISEIVLLIHFQPGLLDLLWMLLFPAAMLVFTGVFGLSSDLRFHNYNWQKDEEVVKQGASSMLGGLIPALISLVCGAAAACLPYFWIRPAIIFTLLIYTWLLNRSSLRKEI